MERKMRTGNVVINCLDQILTNFRYDVIFHTIRINVDITGV